MQGCGAHACTADISMLVFGWTSAYFSMSGSDQTTLLVFCLSLSLPPASPLTLQVSFIEPAVIYCTLVFLFALAIRYRVSDRLKLEVRTFHAHARASSGEQRASLIGVIITQVGLLEGGENTGELMAFTFFPQVERFVEALRTKLNSEVVRVYSRHIDH